MALVNNGDCVLAPDPCYPIHRFGVIIAGGEPIPVACAPGIDHYAAIESALAKSFTADAAKAVKIPSDHLNSDLHGSAEYRAHLVGVMAARAVAAAG